MAFLDELSSNKSKMLQLFLSNRDFVDLVTNSTGRPTPDLSLRYTQVFPYAWVDETVTEQTTFVCFEVDVPRVTTPVIKDVQLSVWVFTHGGLMQTSKGTRIDRLANCIDKILNGNENMGMSDVELKSVGRINPTQNFYGRQLTYTIKDINRWLCDR